MRARPEYEQFARSRDVLARQEVSLGARDRPQVSAFGRGGYGRPGLNPNRCIADFVRTVDLQGADHTFSSRDALRTATTRCLEWLHEHAPATATASRERRA